MTDDPDDDFDKDARRILPPARFAELKALREQFGAELQLGAEAKIDLLPGKQAAAEINDAINMYLREVAKLLSRSEFESLFGFPPEQRIELVDPNMVGLDRDVDALMTLSLNEFLDNVIDNCSCVPACCRSPQRLLISAALRALGCLRIVPSTLSILRQFPVVAQNTPEFPARRIRLHNTPRQYRCLLILPLNLARALPQPLIPLLV